jgi:hypothetical protein
MHRRHPPEFFLLYRTSIMGMPLMIRQSGRSALTAIASVLGVFAAILLASTAIPTVAVAQSSTTGAIGGVVSDTGGALLPGATITVTSTGTNASRTVKSNASGEYRVPELEPGTYSASFIADGFETYQVGSIAVTVGSLSSISAQLKIGSVTDKVEVTAGNPVLNTEDNAITTTLDQAAIDNLPINGRRWSDFALLTPGVVSNADGYGLLSFRGISFLLNDNTVDGADDNQAYFSEARGRTRASYSITQAAVQEFQVNTSNYSAQYGRSAGGVINTVTKSGTNNLHGELFFYDRDNSLGGAVNPYTLLNVPNGSGGFTVTPYKPTDWRKQWGFGVGGPILRDKLFWFYAYDQSRRNFPGTSRTTDPSDLFAPANAILPGGETCTTGAFTTAALSVSTEGDYNACALAALYGVSYSAGAASYTQGLGIVNSFLGTVPRSGDQVINLPKLDYQINDRERLSMLYNRMRYSAPNGLYQPSTESEGRSGWGEDFIKEDFGIARLTSVLSSAMVNDALVQYGRDFEYTYQNPPLPNELPMSHNAYGAAAGTQIGYYLNSGIYAGSNPDLTRKADPDERRLQVSDGLTWTKGRHVAKFGLEFNKVSDYVNNLYNGNGSYSYDYGYTFIADYLNLVTGLGGRVASAPGGNGGGSGYYQLYYSYSQGFGNPIGEIATREYAGYATDDWRILPNLSLTLGLRYDYEYVPPSPFVNTGNQALASALSLGLAQTALPQTAGRPDDRNNIAPRFGFNWNVYGTGKTILRGGYGLYYGRIINSNILQTYEESGSPNGQISISNLHPLAPTPTINAPATTNNCGPVWPNLLASAASVYSCIAQNNVTLATSTVAYLDPHMQNPEVHEADLALQQNLGRNTVFGLTYMMSLGRELPTAIDTNFNAAATANISFSIAAPKTAGTATSYPISTNSEAPSSYSNYPQPPQAGYITQPHGGRPSPLNSSQTYTTKVFLQPVGSSEGTRPNPAYYQILDVKSSVNSSYNALAAQIDHRYTHGFSMMVNYTWSHALDENPYESTVVPSYSALDPTNPRADYGNSNTDVRHRFVAAFVYQPQTNFHGPEDWLLGGWRVSPLVQAQTGLPFNPFVSGSISGTTPVSVPDDGTDGCTPAISKGAPTCSAFPANSGLNGAGSSANRLPWIGRNSFNDPGTIVFDLRLSKNFYIHAARFEGSRFEVFAEIFNVMNHQNITGITNEAYTLSGTTLTPFANFGTYTNSNSNYTYSPRQIQLSARFHF